ncbi:undecaprenyl-diphosphatase [Desulfobacterota bacterium M19]
MGLNQTIFQWIHAGAGTRPLIDALAVFFAEAGPFLLAAYLLVLWFRVRADKKILLIEAAEAALIGLTLNQLAGLLYYQPRPFMMGLCTPLLAHVPENSFPSDHATLMFGAALYLLMKRGGGMHGLILLAAACFTAWARIYVGIHFPFDMAGSLLIALAAAGLTLGLSIFFTPLNSSLIRVIELVLRRFSITHHKFS